MKTKSYKVRFKHGLHARPISRIVEELRSYILDEVTVEKNGIVRNGLGVMDFLTIAPEKGAVLTFKISGLDEDKALEFLDWLFSLKKEDAIYEKKRPGKRASKSRHDLHKGWFFRG